MTMETSYTEGSGETVPPIPPPAPAAGTEAPTTPVIPAGAPVTTPAGPDTLVPEAPRQKLPRLDFLLPDLEPGQIPDNQLPGMAEKLQNIMNTTTPNQVILRMEAVKIARRELNAQYADQQRQLRLYKEQRDETGRAVQDQYLGKLGKGEMVREEEVLTDQRLNGMPERRENIINFMRRPDKADPPARVDKTNKMKLFERMTAPWGTPDKITDEKDIDRAYIDQQISDASHKDLIHEFRTSKVLADENLTQLKNQFFNSTAKVRIMGPFTTENEKIMEGDNAERLDRYRFFMNSKIQQYREAKKNPLDLFNPDNPDYLGSDAAMKPYESEIGRKMRETRQIRESDRLILGGDYSKIPDNDLIAGMTWGRYKMDIGLIELQKRGYPVDPARPLK